MSIGPRCRVWHEPNSDHTNNDHDHPQHHNTISGTFHDHSPTDHHLDTLHNTIVDNVE